MRESVVGVLFFAFFGILLYFTVVVKNVSFVEEQGYTIDVLFDNADNLKKGSPVLYAGLQVGNVESIVFDEQENRARVTLFIRGVHIPKNAEIAVYNSTLFGGKAIRITRPAYPLGEYIAAGETVSGVLQKSLTDSIQDTAESATDLIQKIQPSLVRTIENLEKTSANLSRIAQKVDEGKGLAGRLINDEKMAENIAKITENVRRTTEELTKQRSLLSRLIYNEEMGENFQRFSANLAEISQKINTGQGTVARLLNEDSLYQNLDQIAANVNRLVQRVSEGEGTLGKLFSDDSLYNNLNDTAANIKTITSDIVEQKGLLGKVIGDEEIGENFSQMLENLQEASRSIRNIADKIDRGDGTLATLVNSRELIDTAQSAMENLDKTLGRAARTETEVGLGYFFYDRQELTAYKAWLRIYPRRTRFFHAGAVIMNPSKDGPIDFDQKKQDEGKLLIFPEILLGKTFYFNEFNDDAYDDLILSLRIGLLEGKLGGGIDLDFLKHFRLTLEGRTPHKDKGKFDEKIKGFMARSYLSARIFKYFQLYVGVDNFIHRPALTFGVTLDWRDEDIKTFVSLIGLAN
ncbi:MAG: MCE family protein [Planctomycetota bacterium]|nr:MAG: MCE family protein [Planctomycetota bacterium]